jgi:hypothetical protein
VKQIFGSKVFFFFPFKKKKMKKILFATDRRRLYPSALHNSTICLVG